MSLLGAAFKLAAKPFSAIMDKNVTWGGMAAMSAAPLSVAAVEYGTDGAVSQKAAELAMKGIKLGIQSGVLNARTVESQINTVATLMGISNVLNKTAQNQAVLAVLNAKGTPESPDSVNAAKTAAVGWLLAPHNAVTLLGKTGIRSQFVDDLFENRNDADRHLAEKFIEDIIEGAEVNALGNNKVTREDVRAVLHHELSKPDSRLAELVKNSRVGNGLNQIWPDLYQAASPQTEPQPQTGAQQGIPSPSTAFRENAGNRNQQGRGATEPENDNHHGLQNIPGMGPIMNFFMMLMSFIMGMFGNRNNVTAQTDNPDRLAALRQQNGGNMPSIVTHDGVAAAPAPVQTPAPANTRQLQPAPQGM